MNHYTTYNQYDNQYDNLYGCKEIIRVLREHNTDFQWALTQAPTSLSEFIDLVNK